MKASEERRDELAAQLRKDEFTAFTRAALAEIDFLGDDAMQRREKAVRARAQERARQEGGREIAATLLRRLAPGAPERADLERASSGQLGLDELDAVLTRARRALFQPTETMLTSAQQELASRLTAIGPSEDFEAWKQRLSTASSRLGPILSHIAELEILGATARAAELHAQVQEVNAISDEAHRQMRIDSLLPVIRESKEEAVERWKTSRRAVLLAAELARYAGGEDERRHLERAATGSQEELAAAIEAAERKLAEVKSALAADARRRAVLDGLRTLGYDVHEGLSTATSNGGRIVVRSPASTGYGVEIAAGAAMERLQVRTVAFNGDRTAASDVAEEQRWCGDFSSLKNSLAAQGCNVVIEKALGVGVVPVRVLAVDWGDAASRSARSTVNTRTSC